MYSEKDELIALPDSDWSAALSGQFGRSILVVHQQHKQDGSELAFLQKVIGAAQLDIERDTLLAQWQAGQLPPSLFPLIRLKQPSVVLVFGWSPKDLGIQADFTRYQPVEFAGTTFLWADALHQLEPDRNLKGQLWTALKTLFLS
jgi:hypothetical protein